MFYVVFISMKKVIKLTESDLVRIVRQVIKESEIDETALTVDPFTLEATSDGNIKITNIKTKKRHIYSMKAKKGLLWFDCTIHDFPNGTKIKLSAMGNYYTIPVDKEKIKSLLQSKFGYGELQTSMDDEKTGEKQEIKFTKIM